MVQLDQCSVHKHPNWWNAALQHLQSDAVLAQIMQRYAGECMEHRGDAFLTLLNSLIGQQISVKAADAVRKKFLALVDPLTPDKLLSFSIDDLRSIGLSQQKARYAHNIAQFFLENAIVDQAYWQQSDYADIRSGLLSVKGIGGWTVDMFAMFYLFEPDILPLSDLGIVKAIAQHYCEGEKVPHAEMEAIAEPWRPYRSAASWLLWRSLDPEPLSY